VAEASQLAGCDAVVVPGVGSFGDCAENLRATGLWDPLRNWIVMGRPYLGICLGYQLLFESSEESPGVAGLGVLPGTVVRFSNNGLKVPHMGWNSVSNLSGPLFQGLPEDVAFYFVHSFFPAPDDPGLASSTCEYGQSFAASISRGPLHATQFHPEKSQGAGLAVLRNFLSTL
jgi:glutamine amidotransferase